MLPDFSNRLNNLIKSMEKTIAPAIDPENGMAVEQAALMIGQLNMLESQCNGLYLYEKRSLDNMLALASHLANNVSGGDNSQQAAQALSEIIAKVPNPTAKEPSILPLTVNGVNDLTIALGHGVDQVINSGYQDGDDAFQSLLTNTVLDYNSKQSARERVWFKANNLDPDPSDLASMDDMLLTDIYQFSPED